MEIFSTWSAIRKAVRLWNDEASASREVPNTR